MFQSIPVKGRFWVKCPHCKGRQFFEFPNIDKSGTISSIVTEGCNYCGGNGYVSFKRFLVYWLKIRKFKDKT